MTSLKDKIISSDVRIREELSNLPFILSGTLIGPPVQNRTLEKVNDFDYVIIVEDNMTPKRYQDIETIFKNLERYSDENTDFMFAIADGPMKPFSKKEYEAFFHILLHTEETYRNNPLLLVANSLQYQKPFLGKSLKDIKSIPGINLSMLLDSPLGIKHLQELVQTDSSAYLGWEEKENRLMEINLYPIKFTKQDEQLELYLYSILRSASNTLRYKNQDSQKINISINDCKKFQKEFPNFPLNQLPLEAFKTKRKLRNRKLILTERVCKGYQSRTIDFLNKLEEYLTNYSFNDILLTKIISNP